MRPSVPTSPAAPFLERHRVAGSLLALLTLVAAGVALGGVAGALLARVTETVLAQIGAGS